MDKIFKAAALVSFGMMMMVLGLNLQPVPSAQFRSDCEKAGGAYFVFDNRMGCILTPRGLS